MIEQYTQEWFNQRLGKITSSQVWNLIVEPKEKTKKDNGELSSTAKDYLMTKIAEKLTGESRSFQSDATAHGIQYEQTALDYYAQVTGNIVTTAGYIECIDGVYGGTPDGFVNDDGIIQVKCPYNYNNHLYNGLITDVSTFKSKHREYYWQCQSDMYISGRQYCDFVSFCPSMPDKFKMFTLRMDINLDDISILLDKLQLSVAFMKEILQTLNNKWTR
jgi:exodeoxyribonuclease (lambda-induced)